MPPKNRRVRFHGLKRPRIRQDWNKHNLYNLARLTRQSTQARTFFQQKWTAKAITRAYHGEHINEKKWQRMFSKSIPAVVPMDPRHLAENDGSEHAAGRGSGRDLPPSVRRSPSRTTPYMQMVYFPTERRLDTAIFRALFASSARQARQHVVHGHVKVNGTKMIYPGYMLNPGDMFSVDPLRVLKTTGSNAAATFQAGPASSRRKRDTARAARSKAADPDSESKANREEEVLEEEELEDEALTEEESFIPESDAALANTKKALLHLRQQAADLIDNPPKGNKLSGRQKQDVRAFKKTLKQSLSRANTLTPSALDDLEARFQTLTSRIASAGTAETPTASEEAAKASHANPPPSSSPPPGSTSTKSISSAGKAVDTSDPSRLWRPKNYMSAFAFIPRYLEVNQNICSAVYLRHPVCRPGFAEVPTPFSPETGELAFNWYLRRR